LIATIVTGTRPYPLGTIRLTAFVEKMNSTSIDLEVEPLMVGFLASPMPIQWNYQQHGLRDFNGLFGTKTRLSKQKETWFLI